MGNLRGTINLFAANNAENNLKWVQILLGKQYTGSRADIYVNDVYITSTRIGRKGQIKIPKRSTGAKRLMKSASSKNDLQIYLRD